MSDFRVGSGQDYGGDGFQIVILLDVGQHLAAIHLGQVQIQQDEVRARGMDVTPLTPQKGHGLHAVGSHMQKDGLVGIAEGFLRQPDVARTVFDQQNLYGHTVSSDGFHDCLSMQSALPQLTLRSVAAAT